MMNRALPDDRPPSPFIYESQKKVNVDEPPPPAEYLQPQSANNLAYISRPANLKGSQRNERSGKIHGLKSKDKTNNIPSIFQNKSYVPTGTNLQSADKRYDFTERDMMLQLDPRIEKQMRVSPIFHRPDKATLYRYVVLCSRTF